MDPPPSERAELAPLFLFDTAVNADPPRAAVEPLAARSHLTLATHPRFTGRFGIVDDIKARLVHMIRKVRRLARVPLRGSTANPSSPRPDIERLAGSFSKGALVAHPARPHSLERTHSLPRRTRTFFRSSASPSTAAS